MKIYIKGLNSCAMRKQKLRQYRNFLMANGHELVNRPEDSEAIILWTCAFRGDVRDNSLSEIKRYQKGYKAELIVAGCLPDIAPDLLKKEFSGRIVPWRDDKRKMPEFFGDKNQLTEIPATFVEESLCDDVQKFRQENPDKDATFHDQFIKLIVSEGCNYQCSYCSERLAFPPYHSFSEDDLVNGCREVVAKTGRYEIMLLADSLGDYGCDTNSSLPNLINKLVKIHPRLRIALNNFNPAGYVRFFDEMSELLKRGVIRHLNLPIQSASARMLKLMNRPYTREDIDRIFASLNKAGFKEFDTHVIFGFPGETEADFKETVQFILKYKPKYVLASGFMEAPGMPAYQLPGKISQPQKRDRLKEFYKQVSAAGIICNSDESQLGSDRIRRLNAS